MIELGSKVKDKITGFQGVAIARYEWITGCVRYEVQPQKLKDGKPLDSSSFDEKRLEVVSPPTEVERSFRDHGGPQPTPSRPSGPG